MSNLMRVPHTITFEAIIDLDKIPANMLPTLIALPENAIQEMCKGATLNALSPVSYTHLTLPTSDLV